MYVNNCVDMYVILVGVVTVSSKPQQIVSPLQYHLVICNTNNGLSTQHTKIATGEKKRAHMYQQIDSPVGVVNLAYSEVITFTGLLLTQLRILST